MLWLAMVKDCSQHGLTGSPPDKDQIAMCRAVWVVVIHKEFPLGSIPRPLEE